LNLVSYDKWVNAGVRAKYGMKLCGLYSGFRSGALKYWVSLEDGLNFILDRLEPVRIQIDNYKQKYDIVWWCGHFQSSFDGGPTLSARLMQRLADFGVDLYIDNYFVDSDPPKG